jgi:hypothetical protein
VSVECRYAEFHYAVCRGASIRRSSVLIFPFSKGSMVRQWIFKRGLIGAFQWPNEKVFEMIQRERKDNKGLVVTYVL